jgi:hypothetical protein
LRSSPVESQDGTERTVRNTARRKEGLNLRTMTHIDQKCVDLNQVEDIRQVDDAISDTHSKENLSMSVTIFWYLGACVTRTRVMASERWFGVVCLVHISVFCS